jgi:hypothetical protein
MTSDGTFILCLEIIIIGDFGEAYLIPKDAKGLTIRVNGGDNAITLSNDPNQFNNNGNK